MVPGPFVSRFGGAPFTPRPCLAPIPGPPLGGLCTLSRNAWRAPDNLTPKFGGVPTLCPRFRAEPCHLCNISHMSHTQLSGLRQSSEPDCLEPAKLGARVFGARQVGRPGVQSPPSWEGKAAGRGDKGRQSGTGAER